MLPRRKTPTTAIAAVLTGLTFSVQAAQHQNTRIHYDAADKANVIDLVMSIDWDFDAPPTGLDKKFLEDILRQSSQSLYTMTEGRQMLGKVFVYKNSQFMNNTDIQYLQANGRAAANIAGITTCGNCTIQMFAGTGETAVDHGKTVAHEFGHYIHGLYDEYREEGKMTAEDPGSPLDGDTPRDTIMHNHLQFVSLSTADDYRDESTRRTAHFRVYGKSAWETLVSDPANDPPNIGRLWFEPFRSMSAPTAATLTKPQNGWEKRFEVVWMGSHQAPVEGSETRAATVKGPINVLVLDASQPAAMLEAQKNAAVQALDAAGSSTRIALIVHPYASKPLLAPTFVATPAARQQVKTLIQSIASADASGDDVAGDRLLDWAETLAPQLFPAGPASANAEGYRYRLYATGKALGVKERQVYFYDGQSIQPLGPVTQWLPQARTTLDASLRQALAAIRSVATDADTLAITLYADANSQIDAKLVEELRNARVAVNPVAIVAAATRGASRLASPTTRVGEPQRLSLYDLARQSFGKYQEAGKAGDLGRSTVKAINQAEGDDEQIVADDVSPDVLQAGASRTMSALISSLDGEATFSVYYEEGDAGKLDYALIAPDGRRITASNMPTGIRFRHDADEGALSFTVAKDFAGRSGRWQAIVTAKAATGDVVYQELTVASPLGIDFDVLGIAKDDRSEARLIVGVRGPLPVSGAQVSADINSTANGQAVRRGLVLKDDGVAPDLKAGDGQYTVSLADLPAGEYEVVVKVVNDGRAIFTTAGRTKKGADAAAQPVAAFERTDGDVFLKEKPAGR